MTWCNRCGYDYGLTSHACGGSGSFPTPSLSVTSIDFTNFQARGGNGAEPTYTQADLEPLIESIAVRVEGLSGFRQKPWGYERAANERGDEVGDFLSRDEVLEAIRSTKL